VVKQRTCCWGTQPIVQLLVANFVSRTVGSGTSARRQRTQVGQIDRRRAAFGNAASGAARRTRPVRVNLGSSTDFYLTR